MPSKLVYEVLSEFTFDAGGAIATSQILQNEVGKISSAADQAIMKLGGIGGSFLSSMGVNIGGGIAGSIFGVVGTAIASSEKFRDSQLSIANILSANKDSFSGNVETFNDRLNTSRSILKDIVKDARDFAIDESSLLDMTKLVGAQLAPKGMAGTNFDLPRELARNLLKSAPNLGVEPYEVGGQLMRIIEGAAGMGDTLFRRLVGETEAFSEFKKSGSKAFNQLDTAKRLDILRKGLQQFSSDMDVLSGRFDTITGQMQRTRSLLGGVDSIFRKIGDTVKGPIITFMKGFNDQLQQFGPAITDAFNSMLRAHFQSPEKLFQDLFTARRLGQDFKDAGGMVERIALIQAGQFAVGQLAKRVGKLSFLSRLASPILTGVFVGFDMLRQTLARVNNPVIELVASTTILAGKIGIVSTFVVGLAAAFGRLGLVATGLKMVFRHLLVPLTLITYFQRVLSRAQAKALVNDAKALPATIAAFTSAIAKFKENLTLILMPLEILTEGLANMIAPFMGVNSSANILLTPLQLLNVAMSKLATVVVSVLAGISAFFEGVFSLVLQLKQSGIGDLVAAHLSGDPAGMYRAWQAMDLSKIDIASVGKAMGDEFRNLVVNAGDRPGEQGGVATSNNVTNIGKVEIRNDFKENMEPDRIAHSLVKTIMNAAKNPTQSTGRSLNTSFATGG